MTEKIELGDVIEGSTTAIGEVVWFRIALASDAPSAEWSRLLPEKHFRIFGFRFDESSLEVTAAPGRIAEAVEYARTMVATTNANLALQVSEQLEAATLADAQRTELQDTIDAEMAALRGPA